MSQIESKDIFRIAYLLCNGGTLSQTRVDHQRVSFIIEGGGLLEADSRYRTGKALINPLRLRESLNLLRDIIRRIQNPKIGAVYGNAKVRGNQEGRRSCRRSQETWRGVEEAGTGLHRPVSVP